MAKMRGDPTFNHRIAPLAKSYILVRCTPLLPGLFASAEYSFFPRRRSAIFFQFLAYFSFGNDVGITDLFGFLHLAGADRATTFLTTGSGVDTVSYTHLTLPTMAVV